MAGLRGFSCLLALASPLTGEPLPPLPPVLPLLEPVPSLPLSVLLSPVLPTPALGATPPLLTLLLVSELLLLVPEATLVRTSFL
ncbi:hypothetical protein I314_02875 [Cryptococcus bacillisporus CA1873]|uniref:Secreted protein n=2 Tax=Cryptococcus gattii TaxID=552467 RepID=A0A0D0VKU6_CRYGA|nr:hypothetical protein I312_05260 [Cryptococcus bacillisporus CA1280]KIR64091.1 hypothetical protein I314_02875 [Cryptococcus bacillisporus CA1873]|eukprot:KIR64091.1 hypothetical protein I314_02875 [Cryptococcus gattii CA1873]